MCAYVHTDLDSVHMSKVLRRHLEAKAMQGLCKTVVQGRHRNGKSGT